MLCIRYASRWPFLRWEFLEYNFNHIIVYLVRWPKIAIFKDSRRVFSLHSWVVRRVGFLSYSSPSSVFNHMVLCWDEVILDNPTGSRCTIILVSKTLIQGGFIPTVTIIRWGFSIFRFPILDNSLIYGPSEWDYDCFIGCPDTCFTAFCSSDILQRFRKDEMVAKIYRFSS